MVFAPSRPLAKEKSKAGWDSLLAGHGNIEETPCGKLAAGKRWSTITLTILSWGNAITRSGHRVALMKEACFDGFSQRLRSGIFQNELRWSIGLKSVRPWGYWGLVFTHGCRGPFWQRHLASRSGIDANSVSYLFTYLILRIGLTWLTGAWGGMVIVARQISCGSFLQGRD